MILSDAEWAEALTELGLDVAKFLDLFNTAKMSLIEDKLASMQDQAKRGYREAAFKWHPDKNNGDDTKFKLISTAYKTIMGMKARKKPKVKKPSTTRRGTLTLKIRIKDGIHTTKERS